MKINYHSSEDLMIPPGPIWWLFADGGFVCSEYRHNESAILGY